MVICASFMNLTVFFFVDLAEQKQIDPPSIRLTDIDLGIKLTKP